MTRKKPTAIVVNDDVTQIRILSGLLNRNGWIAQGFVRAAEALEFMAEKGPVNLIITDLYMPEIDGWRFCRLLRSPEYPSFNPIPILVVSASNMGEEAGRITGELGANAFLPQPIDSRRFLNLANSLLHENHPAPRSRVLIVDDSPSIVELLRTVFTDHGYEAESADSVAAADQALRERPYDVVVIDYHLPDTTGDTLLLAQQRRRPECVCIMMTFDPSPNLAVEWMKRGATAYVRKPFKPEYLIELCAKARREKALLRVEDLLEKRTRELQEQKNLLESLLEASPEMITMKDREGVYRIVNRRFRDFMGMEAAALIGKTDVDLFPEDDARAFRAEDRAVFEGGQADVDTRSLPGRRGQRIFQCTTSPVRNAEGEIIGVLRSERDISGQQWMGGDLGEKRTFLHAVLNAIQDGVSVLNPDLTIRYANPVMERWYAGCGPLVGNLCYRCFHGADAPCGHCPALRCMESGEPETEEVRGNFGAGVEWVELHTYPVRDEKSGELLYVVEFVRDITERKRNEEKIRRLATTDELTGVHNRRQFIWMAEKELFRSRRYNVPLALFILDIDRFKSVNDTYGHDAGDRVLKALAAECRARLRDSDLFCRWGGEEFAGMLIETEPEGAITIVERLRKAIADLVVRAGAAEIRLTVSIGLACGLGREDDIDALMKRADAALYEAKANGRDRMVTVVERS